MLKILWVYYHHILPYERKWRIYDAYGAKGLKIAEQVGEEVYKQACIINASFVFTTCIMQYCKITDKTSMEWSDYLYCRNFQTSLHCTNTRLVKCKSPDDSPVSSKLQKQNIAQS